VTNTGDITS